MPKYQTTWPRVLFGIVAGALTVASTIVAFFLFHIPLKANSSPFNLSDFLSLAELFMYFFAVWMIGILLFGSVPWLILHRLNVRIWPLAMVLGFALTFAFVLIILNLGGSSGESFYADDGSGELTFDGSRLRAALGYGVFGAIVGLAVWRAAYRRDKSQTTDHRL